MKKIIGLDGRPLSTRISGVGRYIAEILKSYPDKENIEFHLYSHLPLHETHRSVGELENIKLIQGKGFLAKKGGLYFNLDLPNILRKEKINLFWGSQQVLPPFLPSGVPAILTYYDLVLYLYPGTMRKIALMQQKMFQAYSVKNSKAIVSISQGTNLDMQKQFAFPSEKSFVAYPGIDSNEIRNLLTIPPSDKIKHILSEKYFLTVSTIEPRKNYPFLLDIYSEYRKRSGKSHKKWIIAGKVGWESDEFLNRLKKESEEYKDILIIDQAGDSDLHHLYANCSLFLFASIYEGFGIPLLEAMHHGVSCIGSDIATFREIAKNRIPLLPLDKPEQWIEKILEWEDVKMKYDFSPSEFSWKKAAEIMHSIFLQFL